MNTYAVTDFSSFIDHVGFQVTFINHPNKLTCNASTDEEPYKNLDIVTNIIVGSNNIVSLIVSVIVYHETEKYSGHVTMSGTYVLPKIQCFGKKDIVITLSGVLNNLSETTFNNRFLHCTCKDTITQLSKRIEELEGKIKTYSIIKDGLCATDTPIKNINYTQYSVHTPIFTYPDFLSKEKIVLDSKYKINTPLMLNEEREPEKCNSVKKRKRDDGNEDRDETITILKCNLCYEK